VAGNKGIAEEQQEIVLQYSERKYLYYFNGWTFITVVNS
jgi:hypothetical protein